MNELAHYFTFLWLWFDTNVIRGPALWIYNRVISWIYKLLLHNIKINKIYIYTSYSSKLDTVSSKSNHANLKSWRGQHFVGHDSEKCVHTSDTSDTLSDRVNIANRVWDRIGHNWNAFTSVVYLDRVMFMLSKSPFFFGSDVNAPLDIIVCFWDQTSDFISIKTFRSMFKCLCCNCEHIVEIVGPSLSKVLYSHPFVCSKSPSSDVFCLQWKPFLWWTSRPGKSGETWEPYSREILPFGGKFLSFK